MQELQFHMVHGVYNIISVVLTHVAVHANVLYTPLNIHVYMCNHCFNVLCSDTDLYPLAGQAEMSTSLLVQLHLRLHVHVQCTRTVQNQSSTIYMYAPTRGIRVCRNHDRPNYYLSTMKAQWKQCTLFLLQTVNNNRCCVER